MPGVELGAVCSAPLQVRRRPLRIAVLGTRGIPARYGGFETFAEQLSVRLVRMGFDVTVYAEADGVAPPDETYQGVRVRYRRRPRWGAASVIAYDCSCLWDARREYDLVYMLGYGAAWACWLPRLWGTPVWINVDGLEWARSKWSAPTRWYLRLMEWTATRTATRLIADAEAIAQRFRKLYRRGAPCSTIAYGAEIVDPTAVSTAPLATWGLTPRHYALVVARPEPENHVLEIARGFLQHDGHWPLVIVGDVNGTTAYQRRLLALRSDRIRFVGAVYDPSILTALRAHAAVYLHGHSVGGTNPSLLEAMACGTPIIAHDNPFNREVAADSASYFTREDEISVLVNQCYHLSSEKDSMNTCANKSAQARIRRYYDWSIIAQKYQKLINFDV